MSHLRRTMAVLFLSIAGWLIAAQTIGVATASADTGDGSASVTVSAPPIATVTASPMDGRCC